MFTGGVLNNVHYERIIMDMVKGAGGCLAVGVRGGFAVIELKQFIIHVVVLVLHH